MSEYSTVEVFSPNDYYRWLVEQIVDEEHPEDLYSLLLNALNTSVFYAALPDDKNRIGDGKSLRSNYAYLSGKEIPAELAISDCTVLEMLFALSLRMERDIVGEPDYLVPQKWFWTMIRNLGLEDMVNGNFSRGDFEIIIDKWMNRQFTKNGKGSIFYVPCPVFDFRKTGFWDQANMFLTTIE